MTKIKESEHVVTAWAESASGPGWTNGIYWVLLRDILDGSLRMISLQSYEWDAENKLGIIFAFSEASADTAKRVVEKLLKCSKSKKQSLDK